MVWFKVDDNLAFHRKVVAAGNSAMGLWVRAGSWCAQQLTDGFVPEHMIPMMGTPSQAARLVRSGLWVEAPGGFAFHEWSGPGRQPSAKKVKENRQNSAERQAAWKQRNLGEPQVSPPSNGVSHSVSNGVSNTVSDTAPTRPDLKEKNTPPLRGAPPPASPPVPSTARGTRIPDDFAVTAAMGQWARRETPNVNLQRETDNFRDYWTAKSGKDATKRDWPATWRRWMRKAHDDAPRTAVNGRVLSTGDRKYLETQALKARFAARRDEPPQLPMAGAS